MPAKDKWWIWTLAMVGGVGLAIAGRKVGVMIRSRSEFVHLMRAALDRVSPNTSDCAKNILIAQAAHESNYGTAYAFRNGYNVFNITAGSTWGGPTIQSSDLEYDAEGLNPKKITQTWRKYGSLDEALVDFFHFIGGTRYRDAYGALLACDSDGYAKALRQNGFYTAPADSYATAMASNLSYIDQLLAPA